MRIGELAKLTGVSVRSLRYYEEQGLLRSDRSGNGYREFTPLAAEQVETIQFYLKLGLSTEEIRSFLHCVLKSRESFCREIVPVYRRKLEELEKQITLLSSIKSNLEDRMRLLAAENPELLEE